MAREFQVTDRTRLILVIAMILFGVAGWAVIIVRLVLPATLTAADVAVTAIAMTIAGVVIAIKAHRERKETE